MQPSKLKILIVGSGGREHAVGWKVKQSPRAGDLYFAPGNGGTLKLGMNVGISATDIAKLVEFAKKEKIDLTLALPDDPLALGIVDEFEKGGLRIWGPTRLAAKLEWSKAFAKDFMRSHGLPTAKFATFVSPESAKAYIANRQFPIVVKASGLALGKGVVICQTLKEAHGAVDNIMVKKVFGEAGSEVVVEEFLTGPEISIHAFSDGTHYKMFPTSQDHKKIGEGNTGLNTGGMGTIAPLPFVSNDTATFIEQHIVESSIAAMQAENNPFKGVLYPGLMLTNEGPKILEYNARFGDPETQTYMRLLETDILDIFEASIDGTLDKIHITWKNAFACTIVLASGGYPEQYEKGKAISGIDDAEMMPDIVVFHAGTKVVRQDLTTELVTNGGRVLGVTATGASLEEALQKAYKAIAKISFEGMYYRKDIGQAALAASQDSPC